MNTETPCTCGNIAPHVIARRETVDGYGVHLWNNGALTDRVGYGLPRVPLARPRTTEGIEAALRAGWLTMGEVALYNLAELPALYAAARKASDPGDLRRRCAQTSH